MMMVGSPGVGFMAVIAVSGSVLYVSLKAHQQLLSDFMKRIEREFGCNRTAKVHVKKRVTFADDVVEPSSDNKAYRKSRKARRGGRSTADEGEESGDMPLNRAALRAGMKKTESREAAPQCMNDTRRS